MSSKFALNAVTYRALVTSVPSRIARVFFFFSILICSAAEADTPPSPRAKAIASSIAKFRTSHPFSGEILVADRDGLVFAERYKVSSRQEAVYPYASLSKTFIATAILQFVEKGSIKLENTIAELLPEAGSAKTPWAKQITIKQLLSHTSGLSEYLSHPTFPLFYKERQTSASMWKLIAEGKQETPPGMHYAYRGTNYQLLGLILEAVGKKPLREILQGNIFTPVGMTHTELAGGFEDELVTAGKLPPGASKEDRINFSSAWAEGAVIGTASDLQKFLHALFFTKTLLKESTLATMLHGEIEKPGQKEWVGLGIFSAQEASPPRTLYFHSGAISHYRCEFAVDSQTGKLVIILSNSPDWPIHALVRKLL